MNDHPRLENSVEHHEVCALIPWYVNDTLPEQQRQRVDAHARQCAQCRDDLALQRRIFDSIDASPALDYMPVASLKRLQARIDIMQTQTPLPLTPAVQPSRTESPWRGWMAASIATMAVAIGLLAADRWVQSDSREPNFRTVTNSRPRPQGEVIRAVFAPSIKLVELQTILDEAQLKIVSGPTEAGVYSLAANSTLTVRSSLALLRQHSAVRFAEGTAPESESGSTP
jgi:anti-sigma factor RsiW